MCVPKSTAWGSPGYLARDSHIAWGKILSVYIFSSKSSKGVLVGEGYMLNLSGLTHAVNLCSATEAASSPREVFVGSFVS